MDFLKTRGTIKRPMYPIKEPAFLSPWYSENHADILLLPECFITGYDLPMSYEKSVADERNVESGKEFRVCDFEGCLW